MKTEYQFIHFDLVEKKPKTNVYNVVNNKSGSILGKLGYYPQWRQYVIAPQGGTIFSMGCLNDIIDFVKQLKENKVSE
jgi:hypothetical protein